MKDEITKAIKKIVGEREISLDVPENSQFGDYSTNIAMQMFSNPKMVLYKFEETEDGEKREKFKSPREFAIQLVTKLQSDKALAKIVDKIEVAGPGFINFFFKNEILFDNLTHITKQSDIYGKSKLGKGKKIMVEYAHPNTHKAFHIGHLRNITTGESIARILTSVGYKVVRANYQGDVGMHIAKALWGIKKLGYKDPKDLKARVEFLGKAYATGATAYEEDEVVKKEINGINKKIYSKDDSDVNKLYQESRKWSLDYFGSIYKRVYSKFDRLFFESECYESGKKYAYEGLEKDVFKKSEGAIIFPGSEFGLHDRVFVTGQDVPTYEAKDLGLVKLQMKEFNPEKIIHTVGPEQTEYFKVVFKAQELLFPETKGKQVHVPYGWVRLKEGKMSSRTGKVVLGESLLDEAKVEILKNFKTDEATAEEIAVGAVKYSFLKVGREQDIAYDVKESVSLEGNSGPYLQYTYARTQSVLSKSERAREQESGSEGKKTNELKNLKTKKFKNNLALSEEESQILRVLIHYPEVISEAADRFAPNIICNYLYDLAQKFNTFYARHKILNTDFERIESEAADVNQHRIIDVESERAREQESVREFRLQLTQATGEVLKSGLNLLGIVAPNKM